MMFSKGRLAPLLVAAALALASAAPPVHAKRNVAHLVEISNLEDRRSLGNGRLVELLGDASADTRAAAARALGRIGSEEGVAPLVRALQDSDGKVRLEVIFALGQIGSADARDPLKRVAGSNATLDERDEAVLALGKLGGEGSAEAVLPFLADPVARIRADAAIALARTADSVAAVDLRPLLQDSDPSVRAAAAWAAGRLAVEELAEDVRPLIEDADPAVVLAATKAAGQLEDQAAIKPLSLLARHEDWRVRVNVATSLGQMKSLDALPGLSVLGKDENVNVQTAVAGALTDIPYHFQKDDVLFPLRRSQSPQVRAATLPALAVGLEKMFAMLDEHWSAAGDSSLYVVAKAYETFGDAARRVEPGAGMNKWRTASTFYMKGVLWNPEREIVEKAAAAYHLGAFDTEWPRPELIAALGRDHWVVTACAIHALGEMTPDDTTAARLHRESTPLLIRDLLDDDPAAREEVDIRLMAAEALGSFDTEDSKELLRRLLEDPDHRVRTQAAESLEKLGEPRPEVAPPGELPGAAEPLDEDYLKAKQGRYVATIRTSRGEIEIELFNRDAPRTVQSFVQLASDGFYDGLTFHRVVPNFVIQGGCPLGNGWGHPGYDLRCEYNRHRYERGMVGMAHAGKDTGGSQLFVTHSRQPHLDGRYTIFGRVTLGMEVVDRIEVEDTIESISIKKKLF